MNLRIRDSRTRLLRILRYGRTPLLTTLVLTIVDILVLILVLGSVPRTTLFLILLLEGGLGLLLGSAVALSSTPSISKIGEVTIGTASWSKESERNAERVGWKLMFAALLLIIVGFVVSFL